MDITTPYLLFIGDAIHAKTAQGQRLGLPCVDPFRTGVGSLVDVLAA